MPKSAFTPPGKRGERQAAARDGAEASKLGVDADLVAHRAWDESGIYAKPLSEAQHRRLI